MLDNLQFDFIDFQKMYKNIVTNKLKKSIESFKYNDPCFQEHSRNINTEVSTLQIRQNHLSVLSFATKNIFREYFSLKKLSCSITWHSSVGDARHYSRMMANSDSKVKNRT
jgi:hypothetical protein